VIAARHRWSALLVAAVALLLVAIMGVAFRHQLLGTAFDNAVDPWLFHHLPQRTALWFADIGSGPVSGPAALVIAALLAWRRCWRGVALVLLTPAICIVLVEYVIKPLVDRTFCVPAAFCVHPSFPSGHTSGACSVAFAVTVVLLGPARPVPLRVGRWLAGVALVLAAACCVGLVAALYHYATDVIGAALLCLAVTLLLALALTRGSGSPRDPGTPAGTASSAGTPRPQSHPSRPSPR
jgi:undecaprenyl-diphosphatase